MIAARGRRLLAVTACLAALAPAAQAQTRAGSLGSKDPGLFNLTGSIYALEKNAEGMPPHLASRKVEGVIYTDRIDVPVRDFTEGFPGVTNRFEWFGVLYTGRFYTPAAGTYAWTLKSDDGSRLWLDGRQVIDNDGVHGFADKSAETTLTAGPHDLQLWYFQGPATEIGLQLLVKPPHGPEKPFDLADYAGPMATAMKTLKAEATPGGIRVRLDAALLFDTAKWDLKPAAQQAIRNLGDLIAGYPRASIRVIGYTDAVGGDEYNLDLSRSRAQSVKDGLVALHPPEGVRFETEGRGKQNPVGSNETAAGRTMNRRVEVFIKPQAREIIEATAMPEPPAQEAPPPEPAEREAAAPASPAEAPAPDSPEMIAATNRVKDVIERYAAALDARDKEALAEVRADLSAREQSLLQARTVKVTVTVERVTIGAGTATARCKQSVEATSAAGAPIRTEGEATFVLVRRPAGWVITEIR